MRLSARDYLSSIQLMDIEIEDLQQEIAELRERALSLGSVDYAAPERGKVSARHSVAPFAAAVEKLADLETLMAKKVERLSIRRRRIVERIHKIKQPVYVQLLYKRYVEYKLLHVIADEMNYDDTYIRQLHGLAIKAFELTRK